MAVFLLNICKFDGCGITFPTLMDLIEHIESTHIDYDPKVVEQKEQAQPTCLPLSYVLRFIDATRKESPFISSGGSVDLKRKLAIKHHSYSMSSSNRSNTPTGSELDEDEIMVSESEDSNDSWTTEEFSSEFIMRYGSRHSGSSSGTPGNEKPFACPVPGCKKRYKNVNGIKYHSKNGHKKDGKVRKGYKCHCGKSYKTAQGLKSHALSSHNSSSDIIINSGGGNNSISNTITINNSSNNVNSLNGRSSPSQSIGSSSPSSVSNLSGSSSLSSSGGGNLTLTTVNQSQQTSIITQHSVQPIMPSANTITGASTVTAVNQNSATVNNSNIATNIIKGNLGLISIKTTSGKPTTAANIITANKILKLTATIASTSANNNIAQNELNKTCTILDNSKLKFELTPTVNSISTNTNTNNSNIINNSNNNQGNNFDNLPLTPISPNIQQQLTKTITSNGNAITGATILGTNGNGITLLTTATTAVHGGVLSEKPKGDET